jgi:transcriptional regulator with XRE-family HTH domain
LDNRMFLIRKALGLSQEGFGEKVGLSGSGVSKIESGDRGASESVKKLLYSAYNVNKVWFETGVGEMFNENSDDELAYLIGALYAEDDEFKKKFIIEMLNLEKPQWEEIKKFVRKLARVED